jgi:hypothetical protein
MDLAVESNELRFNIQQVNRKLTELQECLSEELRLKLVKGMSNRELDIHIFEVLRTHDFFSDHLEKLNFEKEKRIRYGLMPIDGADWEAANNERPSIGPRIDTIETIEEDEKNYRELGFIPIHQKEIRKPCNKYRKWIYVVKLGFCRYRFDEYNILLNRIYQCYLGQHAKVLIIFVSKAQGSE